MLVLNINMQNNWLNGIYFMTLNAIKVTDCFYILEFDHNIANTQILNLIRLITF